jgi:hypothetical protein
MSYVIVVWEDAFSVAGEITTDDAKRLTPQVTHSVGHLVSQTDDGVTIAVDAFPQRDVYNHHHFVPSAMVVEIIPLHAGPLPVEYDE